MVLIVDVNIKSSSNLILPSDEANIDQWLINNKDSVIAELKEYYEFCLNFCGEDDDINTIPAKELYEKATIDFLLTKKDILNHYCFLEECKREINSGTSVLARSLGISDNNSHTKGRKQNKLRY